MWRKGIHMITMRTSKEIIKVLERFISKESIPFFLDEIQKVPGTNNSFRLTFRDVKNRLDGKKPKLSE